jgi:two-component system, NarL family, response regulator
VRRPSNRPIRLLIVDDHPLVRMGLIGALRTQPDMDVVAEARDGVEALRLFAQHGPDVVLLDLQLPGMDGTELMRRLLGDSPDARVIVLTNREGDEDIHRAFAAGARSYVLKQMPVTEVLNAIRAVHQGKRHIPAEVAGRVAERLSGMELTGRELEILEELAKGRSNRGIGEQLGITEGTVKLHMKSILSKLCVSDRTQAVTVAHRRGIIHLH